MSLNLCILFTILQFSLINGQQCTEGQESRRNNMYYVCRSGFQVPVACSSVDGIRIEPYANHQTSTFQFTCQQTSPQIYSLVPTACVRNGQIINIGSSADDQGFWYTCTQEGDRVIMKVAGCTDERGNRVGSGGIVTRQSAFLFRCVFNGDNVYLEPYGCIVDGSHYPAGPPIVADNFWYQCNVLPGGGGLELKLSGCMENGQKLYNGSTVTRNSFVFRCDLSNNQARFAAVGCLDNNGGHHMIGETFREGVGQIQYVVECKRDQNTITKQNKQCYYQGSDGQGALDPNCVARFGNTIVKCIYRERGAISAEVLYGDDETFRSIINSGYRRC